LILASLQNNFVIILNHSRSCPHLKQKAPRAILQESTQNTAKHTKHCRDTPFIQKRQFVTTKNTTTKSSVCIWRLVKLITAQFYKKDNFSRRRNTTTKLTKTCVKPVQNLYFFLIKTDLDAQKAALVQSISCFQQVLLPFYVGTHTDPMPVRSTEDSTCHNSEPSH